ncbi:MAG: radical SAM protein [Thermoprotei archaeon]|nr:MAG: radical SAM protein [Thermoprotei archaeon]
MRPINYSFQTGYFIGSLPTGCRYCILGAKIVVFITGLCDDNCWYCPISRSKYGRDVIFVDEVRVKNIEEDIVLEAYRINAKGAGITGGDPILVLDRTCNVIRTLKSEFGDNFHIHLYTSGRYVDKHVIENLESSGLDEIRFHLYDKSLVDRIEIALDSAIEVGVEVPFIPLEHYVEYLKQLILLLDDMGVKFININEFEVSESNIDQVILHGLTPSGLSISNIKEKAIDFLEWASKNTRNISIHYCTVEFKDNVQFRRRILRKSVNTMGLYEAVTRDGTLISIEVLGDKDIVSGLKESIVEYNGKHYLIPTEVACLLGRGVKAIVREYYPDREEILNERQIMY